MHQCHCWLGKPISLRVTSTVSKWRIDSVSRWLTCSVATNSIPQDWSLSLSAVCWACVAHPSSPEGGGWGTLEESEGGGRGALGE
eukprot:3940583-Rhodomonas_salina.3